MLRRMKVAVIIPAAGASRRYAQGLEFPRSKLDEDLGGRPVLQRTVELFTKDDRFGTIIVAGPHDEAAMRAFREAYADKLSLMGVTICSGGKTHRFETVAAALPRVPADSTHVAVHDAARPCTPVDLIERVLGAAERHAAVVPALEVGDTLKRVGERKAGAEDEDPLARILGTSSETRIVRFVEATVPRTGVWNVQTPQVFEANLLRRAYEALAGQVGGANFAPPTDDAEVVERLGEEVIVVSGDARNIKITRPSDVPLARAILGVHGSQGRATHKKF